MSEPKTAQQWNTPMTGETFTVTSVTTKDATIASGAIMQAAMAREAHIKEKIRKVLALAIQDPLIIQQLTAQLYEVLK